MSRSLRFLAVAAAALALAGCTAASGEAGGVAAPAPEACAPGAVQVGSDARALQVALDSARPGDVLQLAATTYTGRFTASTPGTADSPVVLCGVDGTVIDGGDTDGGYALHLDGASWWTVRDLAVRGGQKGVVLDGVSHATLSGLIISDVGQEGLHLRAGSSDNEVRGVAVHRTGLADPEFGEGVYVGSAESNWCRYTACEPDRSDRNVLDSLTVSDTTAEAVDVKEGTSDGVIRDSTLSIAADAVVDSAVDLKGSGWRLASSIVTGGAAAVSVHVIVEPWGARNTVIDSDLRAGAGGVGVLLAGAARDADNVVGCGNAVPAGTELSSVPCR